MNITDSSALLIELHYFPSIAYFSALQHHDIIQLEAQETFQKQTYRNRTCILSAQKKENLLIPVLSGNSHIPIRDIRIDNSQKWRLIHQRAIRSAYGKSPFFEFYADEILALYDKPVSFLFDFNLEVLTVCLNMLKWKKKTELTTHYQIINNEINSHVEDFRGVIHPKKALHKELKPYQQVFGRQFEPNLSIMDLLFCEGNNYNSYM